MKNQQLRELRQLLEVQGDAEPSSKLDQEILQTAKSSVANKKTNGKLLQWLFAPVSFAGNALASILLTAVAFFGMAKMIAIPEPERVFVESAKPMTAIQSVATVTQSKITPVERPSVELYAPDQVLLEFSLPSVPDLIRSMEFVAESERSAASIELIAALADINQLIDVGALGTARSRYAELKQRCYACQLPNTLEALALTKLDSPGHG